MNAFSHKNSFMTILLLFALALSIWLMQQSSLGLDNTNANQLTTPDAFMTEANYTGFDVLGQWNSRIHATVITHYPDQDTTRLETPQMTSRSASPLTWIITADHGTSRHGLKTIYLSNNVVVDRVHVVNGKTLTFTTSALTAYPEQKFAKTDQPVTIVQPGSTVHATGLTANMNTGDIHLLSSVQGIYEKMGSSAH